MTKRTESILRWVSTMVALFYCTSTFIALDPLWFMEHAGTRLALVVGITITSLLGALIAETLNGE